MNIPRFTCPWSTTGRLFYSLTMYGAMFFTSSADLSAQQMTFYLNPSVNIKALLNSGTQFKNLIETETGIKIEIVATSTHEELVSKFGEGKPCFGFLNSYSYVVANTKYGASAKLRTVRYGKSLYYGMIVTNSATGIKSIKDLDGKAIACTDNLSTSGYLYPKRLLEKKGIKPAQFLFVRSHEEVIEQVYTGKVPAGAAFYSPESPTGEIRDARARLTKKYPDVSQKVIILAKTDFIPNEPIAFSKSVSKDLAIKIAAAMVRIADTSIGKKLLQEMYGVEGLVRANDGDYNSLRSVIAEGRGEF